ncbi:MAG: ComEA family DNA-binding protein [Myxococcota bacterium]
MFPLFVALALALGALQASHVEASDSLSAKASGPPQPVAGDLRCINLNEASPTELVVLPGIGPARAAAIVEVREKRRFRRPEDLLRVPGIGRKTFGRIRDRLCVE